MPPKPRIYWITGIPASGKTTLARIVAQTLERSGRQACVLDGDELRQGLCSDLGLSTADRSENIRRAGEVARLMANTGITVVCAFVSPFSADRQRVRALFEPSQFVEVFLSTSVAECARRAPPRACTPRQGRSRSGPVLRTWNPSIRRDLLAQKNQAKR